MEKELKKINELLAQLQPKLTIDCQIDMSDIFVNDMSDIFVKYESGTFYCRLNGGYYHIRPNDFIYMPITANERILTLLHEALQRNAQALITAHSVAVTMKRIELQKQLSNLKK
jgi:hypothetical protein